MILRKLVRNATFLLGAVVAVTLCACSGGSQPLQQAVAPVDSILANLDPPNAIPHSVSKAPAVTMLGREYADWLPSNRIAVEGDSLRFTPDFEPGGYAANGLSFAIYETNIFGLEVEGLLTTNWPEHHNADNLLFGIANFDLDRWDWFRIEELTADGQAQIEFEMTGHVQEIGPEYQRMLIMPLILGTDEWLLDELWLGGYLVIDSVYPRWGMTGETFRPEVFVDGPGPYEYSWDFGGGATPQLSTEPSPIVTAGAPGTYEASVTVSSDYGDDTFEFEIEVYAESDEWTRSWYCFLGRTGTISSINGKKALTDPDGNIYQVGFQDETGGMRSLFWIVKYNSSGMELWNRYWAHGYIAYFSDAAFDADGNLNILILKKIKGDNSVTLDSFTSLIKISPEGELLAEVKLTLDGEMNSPFALLPADDGGFYVGLGVSSNTQPGVLKLSSDYSVEWGRQYNVGVWGNGRHFTMDDSGNIYLTGSVYPDGDPMEFPSDTFVVKLDADGNLLWETSWGSGFHDLLFNLEIGPDGNIYGSGTIKHYSENVQDLMFARLSPAGEILNLVVYDMCDWDYSGVFDLVDGQIWMIHTSNDKSSEDHYNGIMRLNLDGTVAEALHWDTTGGDRPTVINAWDDATVLLSGRGLTAGGTWGPGTPPSLTTDLFTDRDVTGTVSDFTCTVSDQNCPFGSATDVLLDGFEYASSMTLTRHTLE